MVNGSLCPTSFIKVMFHVSDLRELGWEDIGRSGEGFKESWKGLIGSWEVI